MSSRGGGNALIDNIFIHPVKTLFAILLGFAVLVILVLPRAEAFSTIKFGTNLAFTSIGAVVGTIPSGVQAFKSAFGVMGETNAGFASSATQCDPKKQVC